MGRAGTARRERPSRHLESRPRPTAGPDAPSSPSFFARLARLAPAAGLPWACLALALAVSGALPSPAQAQTDVTLVSNFDFVDSLTGIAVGESGSVVHVAGQQFTTGAETQGYVLKTLTFSIRTLNTGASLKASIYTSVNDQPGTELYSFDSPSGGTGEKTVSAQNNATLTANTSYFVVFEDADTAAGRGSVHGSTSFNSYDTDSLTDWSLAGRIHSDDGGTTWGSFHTTQKLAIKLVGEVVGTTTTNTAPTLENDIEDQEAFPGIPFTFQFPEDTFDDADGDPLTYTATQGNGDDLPSWLDFPPSTRTFSGTPMASDVGRLTVKVTASDGSESVYDEFELAVKPTAPTCGTSDVWCATLSVAELSVGGIGIGHGYLASSSQGLLSGTSFTYDSTDYSIVWLSVKSNGTVRLELDPVGTTVFNSEEFVLKLGDESLNFSDADIVGSPGHFEWLATNVSWAAGDSVRVSIVENTPATGKPAIKGKKMVGQELKAEIGGIEDADGLPPFPADYEFQWVLLDSGTETDISGATSQTYTPVDGDVGKRLRVRVSFTDDGGWAEQRTSNKTGEIVEADVTAPTVASAVVNGTVLVIVFDETLGTAPDLANGAFAVKKTPQGGTEEDVSLSDAPVLGDTTVTLTLASAVASDDTVTVGYTKPSTGTDNRVRDVFGNETDSFTFPGTGETLTNHTGTANQPATGAPQITGQPEVGGAVHVDTNVSDAPADADGLTSATYTYQWYVQDSMGDLTAIAGATGASYTLTDAEEGKRVAASIFFKDDRGNPEQLDIPAYPLVEEVTIRSNVLPAAACGAPDFTGRTEVWNVELGVGVFARGNEVRFGAGPPVATIAIVDGKTVKSISDICPRISVISASRERTIVSQGRPFCFSIRRQVRRHYTSP